MKANGIPAIVMLLAGFVDCLIAIRTHMTLGNFTRQPFLVLRIFYVIGCTVKLILDRNMKAMEEVKTVKEELGEKEKEEKEGDESQEEATEDDTEKEKQAEENE